MNKNMTALVSCFARAYHTKRNNNCIYEDGLAEKLLTVNEYKDIAENMIRGIKFFNPDFAGSDAEALRWIVNNNLAPTVVSRSAFCERLLKNAVWLGCGQYLIFAAGYDTFAYKSYLSEMFVLEIDKEEMISDKKARIERMGMEFPNVEYTACDFSRREWTKAILKTGYNEGRMSFGSLLGISYYLTKEQFDNMIKSISSITSAGSEIVFDYPTAYEDTAFGKNRLLADAADEKMAVKYTYAEIQKMMSKHGYLIYEHLNCNEIEKQFFEHYNLIHRHKLHAPSGAAYCLAVKKEHLN